MKRILFSILAISAVSFGFAQDLPTNPEPGKCYVRCTTPDIYENQTVQIEVEPAYKKLRTVPAKYETVTERVLVKDASKVLRVVPATYATETVTYVKKQAGGSISVSPASFGNSAETIEVKSAYAQWEMSDLPPAECQSNNPDDCRYWCYKGYPAEYQTIAVRTLQSDARATTTPGSEQMGTYTKRVVSQPARVVEEEVPAEYATITKTVLASSPATTEDTVPAKYKTVTKEVLKQKGGLTTWAEVDCKLLEYTDLNIVWNLGSADLTGAARTEINSKLLPVMQQGVSVEIASHTDSRGTSSSNQALSERRAQAVTNYLISKGINSSKITSNGYGESKLRNRCADGVSCTEREHTLNRRTQFRVIEK